MITIIFIHGTGVRKEDHDKKINEIKEWIKKDKNLTSFNDNLKVVEDFYWGVIEGSTYYATSPAHQSAEARETPATKNQKRAPLNINDNIEEAGSEASELITSQKVELIAQLWEFLIAYPMGELELISEKPDLPGIPESDYQHLEKLPNSYQFFFKVEVTPLKVFSQGN